MSTRPPATLPPPPPPEAWLPARRVALGLVRPLSRFLHVQAASGIVLLFMAVVALVWANSPWGESYEHLWHTKLTFSLGPYTWSESLHFVINDGLMAIFFFVVGLEIRREMHRGELSDLKRAALPIAAAIGGMIAPALIYLALNSEPPANRGWGVPMATDIAFAVGVLTLLGKRVPAALRVLLLALAIIDDIGAILVIAIFYTTGFDPTGLLVALGGMAAVVALQRIGVRNPVVYVVPGFAIWEGMLLSGIHPTIAGVILGLMTPVRPWFGKTGFIQVTRETLDEVTMLVEKKNHDAESLLAPLGRLAQAHREALPPVVRLQTELHGWVAFGIMPVFALANAGVSLKGVEMDHSAFSGVLAGVVLGLTVGKPLGILLASWVTVRLGLAALPRGVTWRGVLLVGIVGGIGFTMAIFVAGLAFTTAAKLGIAKLGVLIASGTAAFLAMAAGRVLLPPVQAPDIAATTPDEAEGSAEY